MRRRAAGNGSKVSSRWSNKILARVASLPVHPAIGVTYLICLLSFALVVAMLATTLLELTIVVMLDVGTFA
jgi:hypothetical protein